MHAVEAKSAPDAEPSQTFPEQPEQPLVSNVLALSGRRGEARRTRDLVLLVDDDAAIRALCSLALRAAGFEVVEAESATTALELALCLVPDAILSDVQMPGADGFTLALALARDERTRAIPVVFLSGETGAAARAYDRGVHAAAFVSKPFDPQLLPPLLSHAIATHPAR